MNESDQPATGAGQPFTVPPHLERSHPGLRRRSEIDHSARQLIADLVDILGRGDARELAIVDVGCGVKFTRTILNDDIPVARYHGIDVDAEVIAFLRGAVSDPRFSFERIDVHNARYNPRGRHLDEAERAAGAPRTSRRHHRIFVVHPRRSR